MLAIDALGAGADPRARPALAALVRAGDPPVSAHALVALAELGEQALPAAVSPGPEAGFTAREKASALLKSEATERARAIVAEREPAGERSPSP
jgi:hypothetical protein